MRRGDLGQRAFRPRDTDPNAQMARRIRRRVTPAAEPEKGGPTLLKERGPPQNRRRPGRQTAASAVRMIAHPGATTVTGQVKGLLPRPERAPGQCTGLWVDAAAI
jgi:hypothetical protein